MTEDVNPNKQHVQQAEKDGQEIAESGKRPPIYLIQYTDRWNVLHSNIAYACVLYKREESGELNFNEYYASVSLVNRTLNYKPPENVTKENTHPDDPNSGAEGQIWIKGNSSLGDKDPVKQFFAVRKSVQTAFTLEAADDLTTKQQKLLSKARDNMLEFAAGTGDAPLPAPQPGK